MWKKLAHIRVHTLQETQQLLHFLECMNWHVQHSGALLRFTVTYVSLTTLKRSGIAMPTSTGLLPMKTWIDWPVWTFTNFIISWTFMDFTNFIFNFWTSQLWVIVDMAKAWADLPERCGVSVSPVVNNICAPAPLYPLITTLVNVIHT